MAEGKTWTWLARAILIKNFYLWLWPVIGGTVTAALIVAWSRAKHLVGPEIFVLSALGTVLVLVIPPAFGMFKSWLQPRVKGRLIAVDQQGTEAKIMFENEGRAGIFVAKCRFLDQRNIPNPLPIIKFDLQWEGQEKREREIAKGDSALLLLATWREFFADGTAEAYVKGLVAGKSVIQGTFVWNISPDELLPSYDLEVTVLSPGTKSPVVRFFTLQPRRFHGPLKITECAPIDKSGRGYTHDHKI